MPTRYCSAIAQPSRRSWSPNQRITEGRCAARKRGPIAAALLGPRLGRSPLPLVLAIVTLFFIGMSGRFGPASTLVANAVAPRFRSGFMSLNSSVQPAASALANLLGGLLIARDSAGHPTGDRVVGWVSVLAFILTLILAHRLRAAA